MGKGKKTPSGETVEHRISFEVQEKLEEFYTGGQVQVSKDGEHLFTSCGSAVKALHIGTGVVDRCFEEEEDTVICFVLSPDCKFLVVSWRSQQLKLYQWKVESGEGEGEKGEEGKEEEKTEKMKRGKCARSWKPLQGAVVAMAIDPTSTLLATGSSSGIKVWDCVRHYCTHNLRPSGGLVGLLTFHPDPAHLTLFSSTAADTSIKVWDLKSSRCVSVMRGHVSAVTSVAFSKDQRFMISGGRDKVLHVWRLPHYSLHKTLPVFEAVEGLVILPESGESRRSGKKGPVDSLTVATAGDKGVIRVWDMVTGTMSHSLDPLPRPQSTSHQLGMTKEKDGEGEGEEEVPQVYTDLQFSGSRGELVGVTYDHSIIFYDVATFTRQKQLLGYCDEILDMRFLGGPAPRLAVATNSEQVKVLARGGSLDWQLLHGHSRVVLSIDAFVPPPPLRPLLVSSSKDHTVRVWGEEEEGSDGRSSEFICKGVGSGHTEAVGAVAFGRMSGSFVVSGSQDCTIKLWSLKPLSKWNKGEQPVKLPTKYTQLAHDKDINAMDVSPNDKLMVTGSQDKTAKLWNVSDGGLVGVLRGHRRGIWSVQFSPVDQCVLTASADTTLKLWAVNDCSCIKTFEGHTMSVLKAVFITRGMQIASRSPVYTIHDIIVHSLEVYKSNREHSVPSSIYTFSR
ncbi:Transducin beta-like protein 3 [Geodia barretti]|uniref:Transducin beta-like protein 3 n=1 Tax=Geodia barretti TaxID=519541 RepID=A0AA35R7Z5_GEOBA|nr:Transducin beta-like protein 3 [Geodia barretti]